MHPKNHHLGGVSGPDAHRWEDHSQYGECNRFRPEPNILQLGLGLGLGPEPNILEEMGLGLELGLGPEPNVLEEMA